MTSKANKQFNTRLDALIKAKNTMPLDVYIAQMKALKKEIHKSLIDDANIQFGKEKILDQAKDIISCKI